MARITFYWNNLWRQFTVTADNEHPYFPAAYSQHRQFEKPWRSNYGAGSGWGRFYIGATNNKIDFNETAGDCVATLTIGTYDADTLAAEIETKMEAVGGDNYTVEYLDASMKFKITNDSGNFSLLWNTGANKANSVAGTIGFDDAANDVGTDNYTADYLRIHTNERIVIDFGSRLPIHGAHIRGHNFQSTATVRIQGSNDNFTTTPINVAFTIQDDILVAQWNLAQKCRYWRINIYDVDNPDGFVEVGYVSLAQKFQPNRNFTSKHTDKEVDPSRIQESEGGQISVIEEPHYGTWSYRIEGTDQKDEFDEMFADRGTSKPLFYCEDPDYPLTMTRLVTFTNWDWEAIAGDRWNLTFSVKEER